MFKFDFEVDEKDSTESVHPTERVESDGDQHISETFSEILLTQLLDTLPSLISYSPLSISLSSGAHVTLARRDLFDARFQLISESGEHDQHKAVPSSSESALGFLDAPSDLLPGLYEGGLKTWECSVDLVDCLDSLKNAGVDVEIQGKRVLEVGCGTAVPSLYLLHRLFASNPPPKTDVGAETQMHLQDYNESVLELVTVPNIILAWYMSPSSESYRTLEGSDAADPSSPGELALSPALKAAFLDSLHSHNLSLRFFAGSWETFDLEHTGGKYDVVLSSETIYRTQSLDTLIGLMEGACGCGAEKPLDERTSQLSLAQISLPTRTPQYLCLVAAKVLYFGVGGGIPDFVQAIEKPGHERGKVETVWERKVGVGRKVMRIEWGN